MSWEMRDRLSGVTTGPVPVRPAGRCPWIYLGDLHTPVEQVLGADVIPVLADVVQEAAEGHELGDELHRGGQADAQQSAHMRVVHAGHHIGFLRGREDRTASERLPVGLKGQAGRALSRSKSTNMILNFLCTWGGQASPRDRHFRRVFYVPGCGMTRHLVKRAPSWGHTGTALHREPQAAGACCLRVWHSL